ncbi:ABC transporter substrate-binding protein [Chloroflexus sp.]|uniref:ABC transporter substrate-binding protein n=1 Tax=Chloroflexus sp. TaxID=1904827 RepID=UPI002ACDAA5A|nr:extracellular solute-binding protein [Chloroflexus sp.]
MKPAAKGGFLLVILMLLVAVAGCTPAATPPPTQAPTAAPQTPPEQPTAAPAAPTAAPAPTAAAKQPVTLRYANWNLGTEEENNIQRRLVKAYTDLNPHVTIEFVDMSGGGWDDMLNTYAAKGALPDVFMANNMPLYVKNGWLADLTALVANDPDWALIPEVLRSGVTYNGKVMGLPAAQFIMGYFVNRDLYEAANLDAPEYGFTLDEFNAAVTGLHNPARGILGLDEMEFVMGWYPHVLDNKLQWFSFDGVHMNYNSPAFKETVARVAELKPYTWQGLTDEQKPNFKSAGPWELFLNQEVGMRWEGGWAIPQIAQNATFDWDFVGIPGGNQAIVMDIIVVSKTAPNLEEAYQFARWMTFARAAYAKEVELAREMGSVPSKMPVAIDAESLALYRQFFDKPGINAALENLDNSLVESLAKLVPGYIQARWEGKPGIDIGEDKDVNMWFMFFRAADGIYKYEDYAPKLEAFANNILDTARAEVDAALR